MTHFDELLTVNPVGQRGVPYGTPKSPLLPGQMKKSWTSRKEGETKRFLSCGFCFVMFFGFLFLLAYFDFFPYVGWHDKDEEKIWGHWEVKGIGVHNVKLPNSQ